MQRRYEILTEQILSSKISKSQTETYYDTKTGKVKKELYLLDISYYLNVASFGILQASHLTNSKNLEPISQTDEEIISGHMNSEAQSIADNRSDGVDKILNNDKLTSDEKEAKIKNYFGVDPTQGAFGIAAGAFAVSEMQWALRYGMGIQYETQPEQMYDVVNYEGPCPEICTPIIAANPYTLSEVLSVLSNTHPWCRCIPEPAAV